MDAWNKQYGHEDIDSVGDLKGEYTQSIAESIVSEDLGLHSKRHARLYDNGKLIKKFDEPWAEHVLQNL
jgi:peroxiredoxin